MKTIVETSGEGLESLLGETITLFCINYFYTGKLVGVNETCVKIENPSIIYETGKWSDENWADAQKLPTDAVYVQTGSIEAFGKLK